MSAIDDLRRRTATVSEHKRLHPNKDVYVSMEDAEELLREIEELQRNLRGARAERDRWRARCLKAEGVPYWEADIPGNRIAGVEETFEWSDDVIAVTPEQLVRIVDAVRKAQKP